MFGIVYWKEANPFLDISGRAILSFQIQYRPNRQKLSTEKFAPFFFRSWFWFMYLQVFDTLHSTYNTIYHDNYLKRHETQHKNRKEHRFVSYSQSNSGKNSTPSVTWSFFFFSLNFCLFVHDIPFQNSISKLFRTFIESHHCKLSFMVRTFSDLLRKSRNINYSLSKHWNVFVWRLDCKFDRLSTET